MPKIESMLQSADEVMTPSSMHFCFSIASANSIRSIMSCNGRVDEPELNVSRSPDHRPVRLPSAYS
jgi:hypothetical protein